MDEPKGAGGQAVRDDAEAALRASEARYRTLFEASKDAIFLESLDGTILDCNSTAAAIYRCPREELVGKSVRDLVPESVAAALETEVVPQIQEGAFLETENVRADGEVFPAEVTISPVEIEREPRIIVFVRDVSARKRAEEARTAMEAQLRQQQKLESIGTLASGVAHEINNPINIVMNYAELILRRAESDEVVRDYAQEIIGESERIATIVRNLLAFSRQEREGRSLVSVADVVRATLLLVGKLLEKDQIFVTVEVPETLPRVSCRRQQVQQVLMNLLVNARDALNERYPSHHEDKVVVVSARALETEGEPWVRVTVEDRGVGIPDEALERIFDPFYTRKPREQGTGLGLSVSHGIVAEHGGRLTAESRPGGPTRFHVDLPTDASRRRA